jgi:hypothetical protein
MFEKNPRDLAATLTQMERFARERSNFDQIEAKEKFKTFLEADRRFDEFDKNALVARVLECRGSGAILDLDDPRLRGSQARPLDRSY